MEKGKARLSRKSFVMVQERTMELVCQHPSGDSEILFRSRLSAIVEKS